MTSIYISLPHMLGHSITYGGSYLQDCAEPTLRVVLGGLMHVALLDVYFLDLHNVSKY